ncbi:hypothetical protein HDA39_008331 [Kribbella italica]|uniref:Dioxygenase n=1 Tax=Kribbella italica TaxID=1540520 RepID=A0A7W9JGA8_9ACTN|nr:carotenoid oxygenase family protein [Kribbella italica]MBB5841597.1 hypothetical protein [Kribbella italica]
MTNLETKPVPQHVTGHLAPVHDEIDAVDLPVEGALPPELVGRLLRNGPNPLPGEPSKHWLSGHGMVHGIRLEGGRAKWYRNRWVRTEALAGKPYQAPDGKIDLAAVEASTSVIAHAGKILTLIEAGLPYEITPELDTVGTGDFGGRLATAMTSHPKADPATGELHFFGYSVTPPFVTDHKTSDEASRQVSPLRQGTVEPGRGEFNETGANQDRLPEQGREVAPIGGEQIRQQTAGAPILDPFVGAVMGEPDVEVAKLIENRGTVDQRAPMNRIHVTSGDLQRGRACFRIDALAFLGYAGLAHQSAQVDLDRTEHGELKVQQSDDLAVPQGVHQSEVAVVDRLLDQGRSPEVAFDDFVEPRLLGAGQP